MVPQAQQIHAKFLLFTSTFSHISENQIVVSAVKYTSYPAIPHLLQQTATPMRYKPDEDTTGKTYHRRIQLADSLLTVCYLCSSLIVLFQPVLGCHPH